MIPVVDTKVGLQLYGFISIPDASTELLCTFVKVISLFTSIGI